MSVPCLRVALSSLELPAEPFSSTTFISPSDSARIIVSLYQQDRTADPLGPHHPLHPRNSAHRVDPSSHGSTVAPSPLQSRPSLRAGRMATPSKAGSAALDKSSGPAGSSAAPSRAAPPPPPPPVIPSSWLLPHEQRWFFVAIFGLIEVSRLCRPAAFRSCVDQQLLPTRSHRVWPRLVADAS